MASSGRSSRKTGRKVRMPATKFAHLQKRLEKAAKPSKTRVKK